VQAQELSGRSIATSTTAIPSRIRGNNCPPNRLAHVCNHHAWLVANLSRYPKLSSQAIATVLMDGDRKRHCWECRRRCLVCDSTEPTCNRCSIAGISCPGYGNVKPTRLRWLTPGKVRSRKRRSSERPNTALQIVRNDRHGLAIGNTETVLSRFDIQIPISRFEMVTECCLIAQGVEYCEPTSQALWSNQDSTNPNT
jgi:hypothetical protein